MLHKPYFCPVVIYTFPHQSGVIGTTCTCTGAWLDKTLLPRNQWECFSSKYITIIQIYSNIALIRNCYWFISKKAANRLNDSPSAVRTSLPLVIFQQIPEVLFLKGQNNFMGEGFGPTARQKIAKARWQSCL